MNPYKFLCICVYILMFTFEYIYIGISVYMCVWYRKKKDVRVLSFTRLQIELSLFFIQKIFEQENYFVLFKSWYRIKIKGIGCWYSFHFLNTALKFVILTCQNCSIEETVIKTISLFFPHLQGARPSLNYVHKWKNTIWSTWFFIKIHWKQNTSL